MPLQSTELTGNLVGSLCRELADIDCQMRECLAEIIVQVPRDPATFVILSSHHACRQITQLLPLLPNGLFVGAAFGNVAHESDCQCPLSAVDVTQADLGEKDGPIFFTRLQIESETHATGLRILKVPVPLRDMPRS